MEAEYADTMQWNVQTGGDLINVAGNHIKEGDVFVQDEEVNCSNVSASLRSSTPAECHLSGVLLALSVPIF